MNPPGRLFSAEGGATRLSLNERMHLAFQDADIMTLFVQARPRWATGSGLPERGSSDIAPAGELRQHAAPWRGLHRRHEAHGEWRPNVRAPDLGVSLRMQMVLAQASACVSDGDVLSTCVRRHQARDQEGMDGCNVVRPKLS